MRADDGKDGPEEALDSGDGAPLTVGRALHSAREALRLSLEQVAAELRMEAPMLQALEEDRFEALGAPVFVKGYLKHYGHRLGLDVEHLLAMYHEQAGSGSQELAMKPRRSVDMEDTPAVSGRLIGAALAIALAAAGGWWLYTSLGNGFGEDSTELPATLADVTTGSASSDASAAADEPASARAERTPAAGDARAAAEGTEAPAALAPAELPAGSAFPADAAPADGGGTPSDPAAVPPATEEEAAFSEPDAAERPPAADAASASPQPERAPALERNLIEIDLALADDCWTEITDARGERLYYGLAEAGESMRLQGEAPVSFLFGNADAVNLTVGGEPYPVPSQGRQGDLARFTVSRPRALE